MCGIAGMVALDDVAGRLADSIRNLEYRGYDSCGMALLNGSRSLIVRKNIGPVAEVSEKEGFAGLRGHIGIAHTRWATHGGVTQANAHPHLSCDARFTITHNGIISNHDTLRARLAKAGHTFTSETDTEVIVHLIEERYKQFRGVERAFVAALHELEGTYAVALLTTYEPDRIYCARNESPLLIGVGDSANFVASDFSAFIAHTKRAVFMDDGEYAVVSHDGYAVKRVATGELVSRPVQELKWDTEMAQKGGFPHYMLKEIFEQPQVVRNALEIDAKLIERFAALALEKRLFLTGVGTTYYVAQFGQYYFSEYAGITPVAASSDEFRFLAQVDEGCAVVALSQSGETYDTLAALRHAKSHKAVTGAIVNVMGSTMARTVDHLILQGSGPEICVISTKAALAQMLLLARISLAAGVRGGHITKAKAAAYEKQMREMPAIIETILNEKAGFINTIARQQCHINHWLFLGRGKYYPAARESALKMKEVSYVHAEGMPSGFLKHGTIALIDEKLNSVIFTPPEEEKELYDMTLSSAEEIRARDGYTLGIRFDGGRKKAHLPFTDSIVLPRTPPFTAPFIEIVAAQLLSYYTATALNRNIDRPRALAKSVTVA